MVVYVLSLKADMDHVASLRIASTENLCLSVRNPLDHSEVRERIVVEGDALEGEEEVTKAQAREEHKMHPAKHKKHHPKHEYAEAPCHFALKWDGASSRSTLRILPLGQHPGIEKEMTESGVFTPLLAFECEDLEPYDFHPLGDGEIVVTNQAGEVTQADLSNKTWKQFDMATGSMSVSNLQVKFT